MHSFMDLTVNRILENLSGAIRIQDLKLNLISKWGFDGASNQSRYKQKMDSEHVDSSLFMTSLVPLKLTAGDERIWTNPKPSSSTYFCPVQFTFIKESKDVVMNEKTRIDNKIEALLPTKYKANEVSQQLLMTMIDGKICTYLSDAK